MGTNKAGSASNQNPHTIPLIIARWLNVRRRTLMSTDYTGYYTEMHGSHRHALSRWHPCAYESVIVPSKLKICQLFLIRSCQIIATRCGPAAITGNDEVPRRVVKRI